MDYHRRSIRLKGFNYRENGFYFVTFCTWRRLNILGEIIDNKMVLNGLGEIVNNELLKTEKIRKNVKIDVFQIMPNHVHMILVIKNNNVGMRNIPQVGAYCNTPLHKNKFISPKNNLGSIIRGIKSTITKQIDQIELDGLPVWQRNYFEIIIRNKKDYFNYKKYIKSNPEMWGRDRNNIENI